MRKRMSRVVGAVALGCSFQLIGCESEQIGEIVAESIKTTAVEVSTFLVESFVDEILGME